MVEMLGVLAIIGVLSVGGLAGYSMAMAKYRENKFVHDIELMGASLMTAFAGATDFGTMNDASMLLKLGITSGSWYSGNASFPTFKTVYGDDNEVRVSGALYIMTYDIPKGSCASIASKFISTKSVFDRISIRGTAIGPRKSISEIVSICESEVSWDGNVWMEFVIGSPSGGCSSDENCPIGQCGKGTCKEGVCVLAAC